MRYANMAFSGDFAWGATGSNGKTAIAGTTLSNVPAMATS